MEKLHCDESRGTRDSDDGGSPRSVSAFPFSDGIDPWGTTARATETLTKRRPSPTPGGEGLRPRRLAFDPPSERKERGRRRMETVLVALGLAFVMVLLALGPSGIADRAVAGDRGEGPRRLGGAAGQSRRIGSKSRKGLPEGRTGVERAKPKRPRVEPSSAAGPIESDEGPAGIRRTPVIYTENVTVNGMWEDLDCDPLFEVERPIHAQETWLNARKVYRRIVGDESTIGTSSRDDVEFPNGFMVPFEARQSPGKGRGIYAAADIEKGTRIWSTKKTARFRTGESYRRFIGGLERGLACDVLQWAYVQDVGGGALRVSVELDEDCFCNGAWHGEKANVGCDEEAAREFEGGCTENDFAKRDIRAGEELLCAYEEFAISHGWRKFGLSGH